MTNSEAATQQTILDLMKLLGAEHLCERIDNPAVRAMTEFEWIVSASPDTWEFMRLLEALIASLYGGTSWQLPAAEAYARGIQFLDENHPHPPGNRGSEAALLDFLQSGANALENLKRALLIGFVTAQRQQFVRAVLAYRVGHDWCQWRELTRVLLKMFAPNLPLDLSEANPAQYTDKVEHLLLVCCSATDFPRIPKMHGQLVC